MNNAPRSTVPEGSTSGRVLRKTFAVTVFSFAAAVTAGIWAFLPSRPFYIRVGEAVIITLGIFMSALLAHIRISASLERALTSLDMTKDGLAQVQEELRIATQSITSAMPSGFPDYTKAIATLVRDIHDYQDHAQYPAQRQFSAYTSLDFDLGRLEDILRPFDQISGGTITWVVVCHDSRFVLKFAPEQIDAIVRSMTKPKVVMTSEAYLHFKQLMKGAWEPFFPVWQKFQEKAGPLVHNQKFRDLPWLAAADPSAYNDPPVVSLNGLDGENSPIQDVPVNLIYEKIDLPVVVKAEDAPARRDAVYNALFGNDADPDGNTSNGTAVSVQSAAPQEDSGEATDIPNSGLDGILAIYQPGTDTDGNMRNLFRRQGLSAVEVRTQFRYLLPLRIEKADPTTSGDTKATNASVAFLDSYEFPIDRILELSEIAFQVKGDHPKVRLVKERPPVAPARLGLHVTERWNELENDAVIYDPQKWRITGGNGKWMFPNDTVWFYFNWEDQSPTNRAQTDGGRANG
jgi:hypothetical protein